MQTFGAFLSLVPSAGALLIEPANSNRRQELNSEGKQ
jgi:hypothetical protein